MKVLKELAKGRGWKFADSELYAIRKQLQQGMGPAKEQAVMDMGKRLEIVAKAARQVGGVESLKETLLLIERVRGL
jgi:hypothetical protein